MMSNQSDETQDAEQLAHFTDHLLDGDVEYTIPEGIMYDLAEIVERLRKAITGKQPSKEFSSELRDKTLRIFDASTEEASEGFKGLIQRLLQDEAFRKQFVSSPGDYLKQIADQLSPAEMAALQALSPEDIKKWATDLDERISRIGLPWWQ